MDIDTNEIFDSNKVNGRAGDTLHYTPKEGYDFVKFQNQAEGVGTTLFTKEDMTIYFRKKGCTNSFT